MPFGTIPLNDGTEIPAIAFGTAWRGGALEHGFSHIDTSANYGSEGNVKAALREEGLDRSEFYIVTKYDGGPVRTALENSLNALGLKQVDLYLIHQPHLVKGPIEAFWKEFEDLQTDGLTKSIGVSNFNIEQLQELLKTAKVKPAVNQIFFNPYNWKDIKDLVEYSNSQGIVTEAYSSLTPITRTPGGPVDPVLVTIGKRLGATPAQVIFAWVKSKGAVIVTTTTKVERLQEYLDVAELPDLTAEEIAAIEEAGAKGPPSIFLQVARSQVFERLFLLFIAAAFSFYLYGRYFA